jgi:hypothetical protein
VTTKQALNSFFFFSVVILSISYVLYKKVLMSSPVVILSVMCSKESVNVINTFSGCDLIDQLCAL